MARPREFDESAVLDAATHLFWNRGFEASSIRDLADRMGMTAASIYNAYGDKRALYKRVLERYATDALGSCAIGLTRGASGMEAIESFFLMLANATASDPDRKGCLVVNAGVESAPHDAEFNQIVVDVFRQLEALFRDCASRGQIDGSVTRAQSAEDIARLLLGTMLGLRVLARTRPEPALLTGVARATTALLRP
ncbi:MAG: TetR/AcrR family transcriptional regulator [Rhizomicrobium sp.]